MYSIFLFLNIVDANISNCFYMLMCSSKVDDKFVALESLMVSHHNVTLKAIKDEVNSLREAPATTVGVGHQGNKEQGHH